MNSITGFRGKRNIAYVLLCGASVYLGACATNSLEQVASTHEETTQSFASAKAEGPISNQPVLSAQEIAKLMSNSDWRYQNATLTGVHFY